MARSLGRFIRIGVFEGCFVYFPFACFESNMFKSNFKINVFTLVRKYFDTLDRASDVNIKLDGNVPITLAQLHSLRQFAVQNGRQAIS